MPLLVGGDLGFLREAAPVLKVLAKLSAVPELIEDEAEFAKQVAASSPDAGAGAAKLALKVEIDVEAERARLDKEDHPPGRRDRQGHRQAGNESFVARARRLPWSSRSAPGVADFSATVGLLREQRARLS